MAEYYSNFVRALSEALVLEHRRRQTEQNVGGVLSNKKRRNHRARRRGVRRVSRTPRGGKNSEQNTAVVHVGRTESARVAVREVESDGRREDEDEVFSRRALDRVARGVARGERDAFRRDGENGRVDAVFAREREIKDAEVLAWLVSLRVAAVPLVAKLLGFMQKV